MLITIYLNYILLHITSIFNILVYIIYIWLWETSLELTPRAKLQLECWTSVNSLERLWNEYFFLPFRVVFDLLATSDRGKDT